MGESQAIMCVKCFVVGIVQVFGPEYLRAPNAEDIARLLAINKARGLSGPTRFWDQKIIWYIMSASVIMHNMIIENERGQDLDYSREIRGFRHLEEMVTNCVQMVEAAVESVIESAISRKVNHSKFSSSFWQIPEVVTKAITCYLSRAPSLCKPLVDQNQPPRYKLRFLNGLSNEIFTKKGICTANGDPLKICLEENNQQENNSCRLLSAKIKIVVLDGDFNIDNKDCWTLEDFSRHIVRPRDKVGAVLMGELELSLKDGKADLRDATFIDNSKFMRSGKFRLGVMVVDELGERILEGVTEPFTVKDRRGEGSRKHVIPSLDDDVWRLQKISKDGVFHEALKGSGIFSVKDFLTSYYKDEHTLRKVLNKATKLVWTTIVDHAKKCVPGKELYSFIVEGHDVVLFFNCFYRIVGITSSDQYTPFKDLDKPMQQVKCFIGMKTQIAQREMFMKLMIIKDASFDISVHLGSGSEQYHHFLLLGASTPKAFVDFPRFNQQLLYVICQDAIT
ncbi:hypothetical protein TRIUR3_20766 [Triticum urartu]|uniref:Uncharacterized protein n=1 Tax=Triticum urartu TaxID=4572 RepID=M8A664_TRIUA|nr:hypothetical protein TRIUR3_20766 [Triticum urartu]